MSLIQVAGPAMTELFHSERCNIGNGAVVISLRTCDVRINPAMTIDNAAKLAAKTIYQVMAHTENISGEPEWLNTVTFASEEMEKTPAVRIVDNKLYINSPPFLKTKKNVSFWTRFTDYWYIMVVRAMEKALFNREDRTAQEDITIEQYASKDV